MLKNFQSYKVNSHKDLALDTNNRNYDIIALSKQNVLLLNLAWFTTSRNYDIIALLKQIEWVVDFEFSMGAASSEFESW